MQDKDKKQICIVFASTNSGMGKLIRRVTHYKYNHVAISLTKDLSTLYSFARYNYDSPLVGGFVEESALRYLYNDGQAADIRVYAIPVTKEQYTKLESIIENIKKNSSEYIYNTLSAMMTPIGTRISIYRAYTCVEFVSTVLSKCGIINGIMPGDFCTIENMEKLLQGHLIYDGTADYAANGEDWGDDQYMKKNGRLGSCRGTIRHFGRLIYRAVHQERA